MFLPNNGMILRISCVFLSCLLVQTKYRNIFYFELHFPSFSKQTSLSDGKLLLSKIKLRLDVNSLLYGPTDYDNRQHRTSVASRRPINLLFATETTWWCSSTRFVPSRVNRHSRVSLRGIVSPHPIHGRGNWDKLLHKLKTSVKNRLPSAHS